MKLLSKIILLACVALSNATFAASVVGLSNNIILTPTGSGVPGGTVTVPLTQLTPYVIYNVTCPLTVSAATTSFIAVALGHYCSTTLCAFAQPSLDNGGHVGPLNGQGAYQSSLNASGGTNYTDASVSKIGFSDSLTFLNLDNSATLNVLPCLATVVTSANVALGQHH